MLTGVQDADKEILLRLDIKNLLKYYQSSSKVKKLTDYSFWEMKFAYDNLPFLATSNKTFKGWVEEYLNVEDIVNTSDEILKIHAIEAFRRSDPLNLIVIPFVSKEVTNLFDYENFNDDDAVNILIELKEDKQYKFILEGIIYETNERHTMEAEGNWKIAFDILVKSRYYKPDVEILDLLSLSFIENYNRNMWAFTEDEKRIIDKRFGIRDCLYQSGLLWY